MAVRTVYPQYNAWLAYALFAVAPYLPNRVAVAPSPALMVLPVILGYLAAPS